MHTPYSFSHPAQIPPHPPTPAPHTFILAQLVPLLIQVVYLPRWLTLPNTLTHSYIYYRNRWFFLPSAMQYKIHFQSFGAGAMYAIFFLPSYTTESALTSRNPPTPPSTHFSSRVIFMKLVATWTGNVSYVTVSQVLSEQSISNCKQKGKEWKTTCTCTCRRDIILIGIDICRRSSRCVEFLTLNPRILFSIYKINCECSSMDVSYWCTPI